MSNKTERRWTVMVVPHGSGTSRAVELSQTVVKVLAGIGSVVALAFLVLGAAAISRGVNITRSRALENENRLLADEVQRMRERLVGLTDTINQFSQREQEMRLLAGLTPTDAGVQRAGIGGPAATPSIMPTRGWISSAFASMRVHPILHLARPHEGIDVTAKAGAEIEAPAAGIVTDVKWEEGYGNMLTLDHGGGVVTRYAHCSTILVARGKRVKRGDVIAKVGSTGLSTGPHLHYEVWVNGHAVDPIKFVMPDAIVD